MNHTVCPMCGSEHIFADSGMITGKYKCDDCGFVSSVIYQFDDKDYELFKRQLERSKKNGESGDSTQA